MEENKEKQEEENKQAAEEAPAEEPEKVESGKEEPEKAPEGASEEVISSNVEKTEEEAPKEDEAQEEGGQEPAPKEEEEKPEEGKEEQNRKWYVIQTFSGQEEGVKSAIEQNLDLMKMRHKIFQVLVPEEEIIELKGQKRIEKKKKMFPGYVFVDMILDDESWYAIRQTPGVARFIGTKVKPTPVSDREMQRVLKQIGVKEEKLEVAFEKGETVRVISGPFRGYTGTVDEINPDKEKLKVLINIFGRDTPVEVNFEHAEKIV